MGEYCVAAFQAGAQSCLRVALPPVIRAALCATRKPTSTTFLWTGGRHGLVCRRHFDRALLSRKPNFSIKSFLQDDRTSAVRPAASADTLTGAGPPADSETVNVKAEASGPEHEDTSSEALEDVQVLSVQEQKKLAATPAHPDALNAMYGTFLLSCLLERVWRFAWPVVLFILHDSFVPVAVIGFVCQHTWYFACPAVVALLHDSLLPVAVISFASQLVIFVGAPYVGALMDSMPRLQAFNALSAIQTAAMIVSALVTIYALRSGVSAVSTAYSLVLQPWFCILILAGAVERLTGLATDVAIERDWVVQLAGANRPIALANANAMLRRVDLICEIAGPFAFGLMLSTFSPTKCLYMAAAAMAASLPVLVYMAVRTYDLSSGALNRPKHMHHRDSSFSQAVHTSEGQVFNVLLGWKKYLAHPVLPASLAYVLLYFNAVLVPGGLMTSFLTQRGLNPSVIGTFRGLCACMGFVATFLSANVISKLGLLKAGAAALFFQASLLTMAVSVFWFNPLGKHGSLFLFLLLVVLSRLGQWAYDMVDAQIFQTAIPMSEANLIGTTEVSLASLAELVMLGLAIVANDVSHFGGLAALSTVAVIVSAWVYWSWISKPTMQQRRLFAQDPHFEKLDPALQIGFDMIIPTPQTL